MGVGSDQPYLGEPCRGAALARIRPNRLAGERRNVAPVGGTDSIGAGLWQRQALAGGARALGRPIGGARGRQPAPIMLVLDGEHPLTRRARRRRAARLTCVVLGQREPGARCLRRRPLGEARRPPPRRGSHHRALPQDRSRRSPEAGQARLGNSPGGSHVVERASPAPHPSWPPGRGPK